MTNPNAMSLAAMARELGLPRKVLRRQVEALAREIPGLLLPRKPRAKVLVNRVLLNHYHDRQQAGVFDRVDMLERKVRELDSELQMLRARVG